jgi:hypothetical protein
MGLGGQRYAPTVFTPGKDPVLITQEAGWVPEPVWTGAENLAPIGIRSPDRPARSEPLYRLLYPDPTNKLWVQEIHRKLARIRCRIFGIGVNLRVPGIKVCSLLIALCGCAI